MKYRLFIFDWDGTLMDSEAHIVSSFQSSINDLGLPQRSNEAVKNIIGLGLKEAIDALFPNQAAGFHDKLVERYRYHYLLDHVSRSELFSGAVDVLDALEQDEHFMAIATGKGRNGLKRVLDETGIKSYFHATRCADETASKPNPLMLTEIMDELDMSREETLMIGDTEYDLEMASNAGVDSLAVSTGIHEKDRLLGHNPVGCIDHIGQMLDWLESIK